MTVISLNHVFHLSQHAAPRNKGEKCFETFHTFKPSLGALHIAKNVDLSDFKISSQVSPVTIYVLISMYVYVIRFVNWNWNLLFRSA